MASLKEYGIRKFAYYFVIKYSKVYCAAEKSVNGYEDFMNLEISKSIFKGIDFLLNCNQDTINEIGIGYEYFEKMKFVFSKENYMKQLVSRCLKLCGDKPTFIEFLLVCVYIGKFSECIHKKYHCCKILKVTADCLESVYVREYLEYFEKNEGFQGLADFCKSLNPIEGEDPITVLPEIYDHKRKENVKNLRYLKHVDVVIQLNDTEKELLKMADKDYFKPDRNWASRNLFDVFCLDEAAEDGDLEKPDVRAKTYIADVCCCDCGSKCYQYLTHPVNELASNEEIRLEA